MSKTFQKQGNRTVNLCNVCDEHNIAVICSLVSKLHRNQATKDGERVSLDVVSCDWFVRAYKGYLWHFQRYIISNFSEFWLPWPSWKMHKTNTN